MVLPFSAWGNGFLRFVYQNVEWWFTRGVFTRMWSDGLPGGCLPECGVVVCQAVVYQNVE